MPLGDVTLLLPASAARFPLIEGPLRRPVSFLHGNGKMSCATKKCFHGGQSPLIGTFAFSAGQRHFAGHADRIRYCARVVGINQQSPAI